MAMAVQDAQKLDAAALHAGAAGASPQDKENLKKVGKLYWQARTGSAFQRLEAGTQLFFPEKSFKNVEFSELKLSKLLRI